MLGRRLPVGRSWQFPFSGRLPTVLKRRPPVSVSRRLPVGQVCRLCVWLCRRLLWLLQLLAVLGLDGGSRTA